MIISYPYFLTNSIENAYIIIVSINSAIETFERSRCLHKKIQDLSLGFRRL
jgi:hypothetical protein